MLPSTLAMASLRQTSWLRFQTEVQRSESSGGWKRVAAEFMVGGRRGREGQGAGRMGEHGRRYCTRLTPRAPLRTLRGTPALEAPREDHHGTGVRAPILGIVNLVYKVAAMECQLVSEERSREANLRARED